ncbi:serine protease [Mesorhizobium sp. M0046]|uniref:S1 family peptidase n=1 Tax=Mesorhizobium sp. M0046 TaxID=2956858 RepID=UPI00333A1058
MDALLSSTKGGQNKMTKNVLGIIAKDPTEDAEIGTKVHFHFQQFPPIAGPCAGGIAEPGHFCGTVLSLGFKDKDRYGIEGSAVMVGPGVALASRHVLEPYLDDLITGQRQVYLHAITDHGLMNWRVHQFTMSGTDIAILRADLASAFPPSNQFWCAALTTRTPAVGERIMIVGFRTDTVTQEEMNWSILGETRVGIGEVTAAYPGGRDRVMAPNPCIEVRCMTLGGMSGGPAFDQEGKLIGLLSSSFEHDEGPSYVSLLWPALTAEMSSSWPPGITPVPISLLGLTKRGLAKIDRPEAVRIVEKSQVQYVPWS